MTCHEDCTTVTPKKVSLLYRLSSVVFLFIMLAYPAAAQRTSSNFYGMLSWTGSVYITPEAHPPVSFPEWRSRARLAYEHTTADFTARLQAETSGTWGAHPVYSPNEAYLGTISLKEMSVTVLNYYGEWVLGRHDFLLPHAPDDYRRFGLLAGNSNAAHDGLSWFRPIGDWQAEATLGILHIVRDNTTGRLIDGDIWSAVRAAKSISFGGWEWHAAPTLLLSDAVDSVGWSVPWQITNTKHTIEGEVAQYMLSGADPSIATDGWYTAWLLRYTPSTTYLEGIEIAHIPMWFRPYLGNLADRGGRLSWAPGDKGVQVELSLPMGYVDATWRQYNGRSPIWEVAWNPSGLPDWLASSHISARRQGNTWQAGIHIAAGFQF